MSTIANEAQRLGLLFRYGIVSASEIITWADSKIVGLDLPPAALIELSTTAPSETGAIMSRLHGLTGGADFWLALRAILHRIRDYLVAHPEAAERIAGHLYTAATTYEPVPADLGFLYRFEDAFYLANEGTCGDRDTVFEEFLSELGRFGEKLKGFDA